MYIYIYDKYIRNDYIFIINYLLFIFYLFVLKGEKNSRQFRSPEGNEATLQDLVSAKLVLSYLI